jgi:hypothetical protein
MRADDLREPPPGSPEPGDNARRRLEQELASRFGAPEPVVDDEQLSEAEHLDAGSTQEHRQRD